MSSWRVRVTGILLMLATFWYLPWVLANLDWGAPWLSIPFAVASVMIVLMCLVTIVNHWQYRYSEAAPVLAGSEPNVAVIIPTFGEPEDMVYETAKSVLEQDYPQHKIRLVISDDARRQRIRGVVERLQEEYPGAFVGYHRPPPRGDPQRRGEAKAGNLNSVLKVLDRYAPHLSFVETRDADDVVGDPSFLRQSVGQLMAHPDVAFVQTIKEAKVSPGDPFGNLEPLFYRRAMFARNAANAVFPCGSGLVWRRAALADIGGFPSWNLVEDLQSGVEALRRGWRGVYLPIVGALGQTAPEDIPNLVTQRGTWALDTMRLWFWAPKKGLNVRQYLSFLELGLFYLLSFGVLVFTVTPIFALAFGVHPIITSHGMYALHFWPFAVATELWLISLAGDMPYETLWRARQTWLGLAPVYARATILALIYGAKRKPHYRVTRKENIPRWYWREAFLPTMLLVGLAISSAYHVATHSLLQTADLGSLFWAAFFILVLSRIVRNSWFGAQPGKRALESLRRIVRPAAAGERRLADGPSLAHMKDTLGEKK